MEKNWDNCWQKYIFFTLVFRVYCHIFVTIGDIQFIAWILWYKPLWKWIGAYHEKGKWEMGGGMESIKGRAKGELEEANSLMVECPGKRDGLKGWKGFPKPIIPDDAVLYMGRWCVLVCFFKWSFLPNFLPQWVQG